ncbi:MULTISPECIES: hypothetical protein [Pantoea]|jgi:hypothetical protein|uniref:hypothetical protein n=1 Tax=Pantoea TaxID=53335 RepID=UPI000EA224EB|nr:MULTISPECIES: hypothetical protein [Pantoea]MBZ6385008.1 hypothetical protein [Pantoea piersonii]MBZ6401285.1 hypothetical protein [Pantoea piersonii]MBZ6409179.1 hypothetical protein [Pantoea piersonii]MBZ6426173.1 hypothetical protein [Pantoea piersonii]NYB00746.1 hypothetical protein [Pantoea piersonii]
MGQRKDYNQRASEYLNADAASRISAIRNDLNKLDNINIQEQPKAPEKAREKQIPCPRRIDGTPFIEYSPGYLIHQDNFEDYVSGERKLSDEQREQVDANSISQSWEWFVVKWRTAWTLESWDFKAWPCTLADDLRQVHRP